MLVGLAEGVGDAVTVEDGEADKLSVAVPVEVEVFVVDAVAVDVDVDVVTEERVLVGEPERPLTVIRTPAYEEETAVPSALKKACEGASVTEDMAVALDPVTV